MKLGYRFTLVLSGLLLISTLAVAQTTGEIRGQVKDSTGAVLPGVNVEAKGPALQGTKTAVTGPDGSYRISLLPPGEYTVTFSISGFGAVSRRTAVQLDKTVVVDGSLSLSASAEVTVSGAAPRSAGISVGGPLRAQWVGVSVAAGSGGAVGRMPIRATMPPAAQRTAQIIRAIVKPSSKSDGSR